MEKTQRVINCGTASLIMIFTVLALVTFALLSCSSAGAQWRLACKMAERTSRYYEAEQKAAVLLEQLGCEEDLFSGKENETGEEQLTDMLREDGLLCWDFPVEENQQLEVRVRMLQTDPTVSWELESWKLQGTEKEENGQRMQLYSGN